MTLLALSRVLYDLSGVLVSIIYPYNGEEGGEGREASQWIHWVKVCSGSSVCVRMEISIAVLSNDVIIRIYTR